MIIAVVGSGGKTTTIKKMAKNYLEQGKKVFLTTTTHMLVEEDTLLTDNPVEIIEQLEQNRYVMAGMPEEHSLKKIKSLSQETYLEVCKHADVVLVEADGSKHLPLKYPGEHEPVIPDNADEILVICGLHGLEKTAKEACHRLELVKSVLDIEDDTVIQPTHVQRLIEEGYVMPLTDKYTDKKISVQATHDGSLYQRAVAALLKDGQDVEVLKKEWFSPQPKLIICGGGHVGREVAVLGSKLDFYVKVIDDREELVNEERFPTADERIVDSFENLNQYLEEGAFYVVVTPDHKADHECVKKILPSSYAYLGMIGSKLKVARTYENLKGEGFQEEQLATIHAPIGLAIGAVTPAEIAVSIMAEIIQEKNKNRATFADTELLNCQDPGVLCIIIEKHGSAPRGVGSMMFVGDEKIIGTIGGGAAEHMAINKAYEIEKVTVEQYTLEKNFANGLDMICGGNIKVIFIPL